MKIINVLNPLIISVNPYSPNFTFLYPLKTSENRRFSDVFRGYSNVALGEYGLSAKPTKWLNTVEYVAGLALKGKVLMIDVVEYQVSIS